MRQPRAQSTKAEQAIELLPSTHTTLLPTTTMAPKKPISTDPSPAAIPASSAKQTHAVSTASSGAGSETRNTKASLSKSTASSSSGSLRNAQDAQEIALGIWNNYVDKTPQRVKLLDVFMVFLMTVGLLQFVYVVLVGNYVSYCHCWAGEVC